MRYALLSLLALALSAQPATAQITLETFHSGVPVDYGRMSGGELKYVFAAGVGSGQFTIYNADHTVNQQITIPPIAGYSLGGVSYLSNGLFDTNPATLEFVTTYLPVLSAGTTYKTVIYGAQMNVLATLDSVGLVTIHNTEVGTKLIASVVKLGTNGYAVYRTRFYALPGHYSSPLRVASETDPAEHFDPWPNPAAGTVRLPYELKAGQSAPLTVLDATGRVVRTLTVGSAFTDVLLDTRDLAPGVYTYRVMGSSGQFVVAQ